MIFASVYVDDIVVITNDHKMMQCVMDNLNTQFALKDMGELYYFLGIEVRRHESCMFLTQVKYIKDLLKRFNFKHLKPCATLMSVGKCILKNKDEKDVKSFLI